MKIIDGKSVYSVSEVNSLTRQTLENMSFWVEGEISSFKGLNNHYRYLYFDLKDSNTGYKLPCILEPATYQQLDFVVADGIKVLALGNLSLYEKEAKFQMYVHQIEEYGEGILAAQLEGLKRKLEAKGYFDHSHKIPLSSYPTNIAVISSKIADAWFDFKRHSVDHFPVINITFFDVMVQGPSSVGQIVKSIQEADKVGFDAIVIIRGGGSLEDLSAYNDELVADAIYKSKTCIVVGVGHEKDVTIAQLVADIAASTPTDAAKIITADFVNLEVKLESLREVLDRSFLRLLSSYAQRLDLAFHKLVYYKEKFEQLPRHLNFLRQSLAMAKQLLFEKQSLVTMIGEKLILLSPVNTLARGYSIVRDEQYRIVKSSKEVDIGSNLKVQFSQGKITSKVVAKEEKL